MEANNTDNGIQACFLYRIIAQNIIVCIININLSEYKHPFYPTPVYNPCKPVDNLLIELLITIELSTGKYKDRDRCG